MEMGCYHGSDFNGPCAPDGRWIGLFGCCAMAHHVMLDGSVLGGFVFYGLLAEVVEDQRCPGAASVRRLEGFDSLMGWILMRPICYLLLDSSAMDSSPEWWTIDAALELPMFVDWKEMGNAAMVDWILEACERAGLPNFEKGRDDGDNGQDGSADGGGPLTHDRSLGFSGCCRIYLLLIGSMLLLARFEGDDSNDEDITRVNGGDVGKMSYG
ncbi:hypothetical protein ACLOJK_014902 [Asimina triloba]